jgi:hypothetical protein
MAKVRAERLYDHFTPALGGFNVDFDHSLCVVLAAGSHQPYSDYFYWFHVVHLLYPFFQLVSWHWNPHLPQPIIKP